MITADAVKALEARVLATPAEPRRPRKEAVMRSPEQIIKRPLLTEKGTRLKETGGRADGELDPETLKSQLLFEVASDANKVEIRNAVETLFNVNVARRAHADRARQGEAHGPLHRQALELEEGDRDPRGGPDTIEFFEGV